jgi:hypothetical protein
MRNLLRIGLGKIRKTCILCCLKFPLKTVARYRTVCHRAMRIILRVGPAANPQDTAAEPPSVPCEDRGTVADGMPPGDPQDTAAGRPPLLAETAARYHTLWISPKEPSAS